MNGWKREFTCSLHIDNDSLVAVGFVLLCAARIAISAFLVAFLPLCETGIDCRVRVQLERTAHCKRLSSTLVTTVAVCMQENEYLFFSVFCVAVASTFRIFLLFLFFFRPVHLLHTETGLHLFLFTLHSANAREYGCDRVA